MASPSYAVSSASVDLVAQAKVNINLKQMMAFSYFSSFPKQCPICFNANIFIMMSLWVWAQLRSFLYSSNASLKFFAAYNIYPNIE